MGTHYFFVAYCKRKYKITHNKIKCKYLSGRDSVVDEKNSLSII